MHRFFLYSFILIASAMCNQSKAQYRDPSQAKPIAGIVLDADNLLPLQSVQISSTDAVRAVVSNEHGKFRIQAYTPQATLIIAKEGYFTQDVYLLGRDSLVVYLQSATSTLSINRYSTSDGDRQMSQKNSSAQAINRKDITQSFYSIGDGLSGRFAGLRVTGKGGMPSEGSVLNLHGIRSMLGQNSPLVVIDGIPYLPDQKISNIIGGFSSDVLEPINIKNVERVTLLRGAEAMPYGSLSSNGVLMIETMKGLISKPQVEFETIEGVAFNNRTISLMGISDYRKYLSDIAGSRYTDSDQIIAAFPFMGNSMTDVEKLRYGYNTNWQKRIYSPGFVSENLLKVRGGDAVVKFMLTAGFLTNDGVIEGTSRNKFYTSGNTNINFSSKLTAYASVSFDFLQMDLQEQGMSPQTNPMLAAYSHSPMTGIRQVNNTGLILPSYSQIDPVMQISNPAAILGGDIDAKNKTYDILVNTGADYRINSNWRAHIGFGVFYNYIKDDIFIGGKTSKAVAPLMGGLAENTVRSGSSEAQNYYGKASVHYNLSKNSHTFAADVAWQIMSSRHEASSGSGINTTSDRYRDLSSVDQSVGRSTGGYSELWNWMDVYLTGNYNYKHQLYLTATVTADASSVYGTKSDRWFIFPGVKAGWQMKNTPFLRDYKILSNLMLRAEYSINPNSRYDSRYGSYYYVLKMLRNVSGLVREGVPDLKISPEKVTNINIGLDVATLGDKFTFSVDLFEEYTRDMIIPKEVSSIYGVDHIYKNSGAMRTRGADFAASALIFGGKFSWRMGANISTYRNQIADLGGEKQQIITLENGITMVNRVGDTPFSYYGHKAEGVYTTTQQATEAGLHTLSGYSFTGGDITFRDRNNDGIISDNDRQILGNATPDFFGGVYSKMSWKGLSLFVNFAYSYGADLYNGVRHFNESGSGFGNQASSMAQRWVVDGQKTNIPRVAFNDPAGNNRFSSRWIEDGSYLKMKEITLSYEFTRKILFINSLKIYVTGENLLTFTKYKGLDPEFAYNYDMNMQGMDLAKVPIPRFVKAGIVLNF